MSKLRMMESNFMYVVATITKYCMSSNNFKKTSMSSNVCPLSLTDNRDCYFMCGYEGLLNVYKVKRYWYELSAWESVAMILC